MTGNKTSSLRLFGLPLYDIALRPDPQTGQSRATGILAIGVVTLGYRAVSAVAVGHEAHGAAVSRTF